MDRLRRIGLILIVVYGVLGSFSLVDSYIAGELSIERLVLHLAAMTVLLLLFFHYYRVWMKRIERRRTIGEIEWKFLKVHAINGWHPIILFLLTLIVAPITYVFFHSGLDKITTMMWITYGIWVSLLLFIIFHLITGKIEIDAEGIWTSSFWRYFSWDDFEKAKVKWNGKLLILGRDDVYILPKPSEFIKAIEKFKPKPSKE